jgi:hypothetical protein
LLERCCGILPPSSAVEIAGALLWSFDLYFSCRNRGSVAVKFCLLFCCGNGAATSVGLCGKLCLWKCCSDLCGIRIDFPRKKHYLGLFIVPILAEVACLFLWCEDMNLQVRRTGWARGISTHRSSPFQHTKSTSWFPKKTFFLSGVWDRLGQG